MVIAELVDDVVMVSVNSRVVLMVNINLALEIADRIIELCRPTKRAPDAEEVATSQAVINAETLSTSDGVPPSAPARVA